MTDLREHKEHLIPHGESPFRNDQYVGRLLLANQDFIGADDFQSFADAVAEIRASGKKVVLNAGDSSTAGWDTRVTVENQERRKAEQPLLSAFFRYPTYADLLRDQVGDDYIVLNAGIPGHTSINLERRLRGLLQQFDKAGIKVDLVTLYIGNNDCQWENNAEDKHRLRSSRTTPLARSPSNNSPAQLTMTISYNYSKAYALTFKRHNNPRTSKKNTQELNFP